MYPSVEDFAALLSVAQRNAVNAAGAVVAGRPAPSRAEREPATPWRSGAGSVWRLRVGPPEAALTGWLLDTGHGDDDGAGHALLALDVAADVEVDVGDAYAAAYAATLRDAGAEVIDD
jgi:hypothetical protein